MQRRVELLKVLTGASGYATNGKYFSVTLFCSNFGENMELGFPQAAYVTQDKDAITPPQ
jgi:hypothetical protein